MIEFIPIYQPEWAQNKKLQDYFLQKEARVCVSNAFVLEVACLNSVFLLWKMSKWQRKQIRSCEYSGWVERHARLGYCGMKWLRKQCEKKIYINSLWPRDTTCRHRSGSTFVQIMAYCLRAPSHCLNQRWLIISEVQWYSRESNIIRDTSTTNL